MATLLVGVNKTITWERVARIALIVGAVGLLTGALLASTLPQRPDGDATALAHFDAQYRNTPLHNIRHTPWLNLSGALLAWGLLAHLLHGKDEGGRMKDENGKDEGRRMKDESRHPSSLILHPSLTLILLGLLLAWSGWAWNQTRGWQGELFLEPGVAMPLGVDQRPTVEFSHFLIPPAADGPGRALSLRLLVEGHPYDISEAAPFQDEGWTLTPRWYGATLRSDALTAPLFFGGDGTQRATLRSGGKIEVTVDIESLEYSSHPPLDNLHITHHAILLARFAPGQPLQWAGLLLAALATLLTLAARRYNTLRAIDDA